jgi:hypothetical protein
MMADDIFRIPKVSFSHDFIGLWSRAAKPWKGAQEVH